MRTRLLIGFCLGISLIILGTSLFIWYAGRRLARGTLLFGVSQELLANPPIASKPGIADRIVHGIDPISLLDDKPTGASNAATYYIEVIRSMAARDAAGSLERLPDGAFILTDNEFETFIEGVHQATCDFSTEAVSLDGKPVRIAPATAVSDNIAHVSWLRQAASAVAAHGEQYEASDDIGAAIQCYEGTVKFGFDVESDRESILQALVGASIQKAGASKLKQLYESEGDSYRAQQWSDFLDDLEVFTARFKDKMQILTRNVGLGPEAVANGLWMLEHDEDHVFRREAIAGLGVSRIFAKDVVDPVLEKTAHDDPDPYVREAAQNALLLAPLREEGN